MGVSRSPGETAESGDPSLDVVNWHDLRAQSHRMLDDMLDYVAGIRDRPVWQPMDADVRAAFRADLPKNPTELSQVHQEFLKYVLPYASGNVHPGFMGWVQGGGTTIGMLAEMLASGLNANCGGRDHALIEIERQVIDWSREIFGFPKGTSGVFVTGASMANFIAVLVARRAALGSLVRQTGLVTAAEHLVAYTSVAAHACISRAMDYAGLGSNALRLIPVDQNHCIDLKALQRSIANDRSAGFKPFLVIGNAGTVDIGAIDDLAALAELAAAEKLWFHIDGAYGALGILSPKIAPRLSGMERAHSLALDFHKWAQVPYEAGLVLVRDGSLHRDTFATAVSYLQRASRGLAAGDFWPHDFGPDLSRSCRALKTWFTLRVYGVERIGETISRSLKIARHLEKRIAAEPRLELLAPVQLNIVCFRYRTAAAETDALNAAIVADIQESGIAVPSLTRIDGRLAIRAALFNHRTQECDVDALVDAVLRHGDQRVRLDAHHAALNL